MELNINFSEKLRASADLVSSSSRRNIGYFFLQQLYHDLDIHAFFDSVMDGSKITFDPNLVNRFLTCSRFLDPDSKLGTSQHLGRYYEQPDFSYIHILRTMDLMERNYDSYISHLFEKSSRMIKRDTSVCYYDCTNYYFEIEAEDEDYVDEVTGEVIEGIRKFGPSKEHRPNPIVEMGLFMDADGIPLSMCVTSGSDNEQATAIPLEKKLARMLQKKKFIYCADAGLGSLHIRNFNSMGGRAFIVTQSVKKMSDKLKKAVFNDYDYKLLSSDQPVTISEMKDFDKKDERNRHLYQDKAYKKMLEDLDPETYKKGPHDVTRFIKRTSSTKTGEKVTDFYEIDQKRIEDEEKYDGYYAVATNLDDPAKNILDISSKRYQIEDRFRIMKTNLCAHPVYHQKPCRIIAHFMICYTALLIYRILEKKLTEYGTHFTIENIIETLNSMEVINIEDMCYMSTYNNSQVCTALNGVFGLGLDKKYYQPKELNKKIKKISK